MYCLSATWLQRIFVAMGLIVLSGCSGGGSDGGSGSGGGSGGATYSVGGTVLGLVGSGLVLRNNGGDDLPISANGNFTFTTAIANNASYSVAVQTQPSGPAQTCTVSSGGGTVSGANVTNVQVVCPAVLYGTVSGSSGPLNNILVTAYSWSTRLSQASTRTDASGSYSFNIPAGDYVLSAVNDGTASFGASKWWTAGGSAVNQSGAEKITFGAGSLIRNFSLSAGGRVTGTITAQSGGTALQDITVRVRDFRGFQTAFTTTTGADGSYTLNVEPGDYYLVAANHTSQAYATQLYNSSLTNGATNYNTAEKVSPTANGTVAANMELVAGNKISGNVSDPTTGNVPGIVVLVLDSNGSLVDAFRTDSNGNYTFWVKPATGYSVVARGQKQTSLNLSSSNQTADFSGGVGTVTAVLKDASNNPVSGIAVRVYDDTATSGFYAAERSLADGSVTIYAPGDSVRVVEARTDAGQSLASVYFDNTSTPASMFALSTTNNASSTTAPITFPSNGSTSDQGTITLTSGVILRGTVTDGSSNPYANATIQIRQFSTSIADRYESIRTSSDGSYLIGVPANTTFAMVCAFTGTTNNCPPVSGDGVSPGLHQYYGNVTTGAAGTTTTLDFSF